MESLTFLYLFSGTKTHMDPGIQKSQCHRPLPAGRAARLTGSDHRIGAASRFGSAEEGLGRMRRFLEEVLFVGERFRFVSQSGLGQIRSSQNGRYPRLNQRSPTDPL